MSDGSDRTTKPGRSGANDASSPREGRPPDGLVRIPDDRIVDADVREDLRAGREPFTRIMAAGRSLPPGGVLRVRAIFEPVPLYRVMADQGLEHWTERLGPEDWRVWFFEPGLVGSGSDDSTGPSGEDEGAAEGSVGDDRTDDGEGGQDGERRHGGDDGAGGPEGMAGEVVLDVRGMEPPEPMVRTLEALEELPEAATLLQVNARIPRFLLPRLEERGFTWEIDEREDDEVRVRIRRADTGEDAVRTLDVRPIPPREKHPAIFATWEALEPGQTFVLVNDHDPKPLRYQFQYEHTGEFAWRYLEEGPTVWRVEIGRTEPGKGKGGRP